MPPPASTCTRKLRSQILNTYLFLTAPSLKHLQNLLIWLQRCPLNQIHPLLSVFIICYLYESKEDDLCFGNRLTPKCQCLHTSKIYLTTTEHKSSFHPPPWSSAIWHSGSGKVTTAREEKDKDSSPRLCPEATHSNCSDATSYS